MAKKALLVELVNGSGGGGGDYVTLEELQQMLNDYIKKESEDTQYIDSNISFINRKGIYMRRVNGADENAITLGVYGTYEHEEHGSMADPLCLNHNSIAIDGTIVGKNIIVNYRDADGNQQADQVAYLSDLNFPKQFYLPYAQGSAYINILDSGLQLQVIYNGTDTCRAQIIATNDSVQTLTIYRNSRPNGAAEGEIFQNRLINSTNALVIDGIVYTDFNDEVTLQIMVEGTVYKTVFTTGNGFVVGEMYKIQESSNVDIDIPIIPIDPEPGIDEYDIYQESMKINSESLINRITPQYLDLGNEFYLTAYMIDDKFAGIAICSTNTEKIGIEFFYGNTYLLTVMPMDDVQTEINNQVVYVRDTTYYTSVDLDLHIPGNDIIVRLLIEESGLTFTIR